MQDKSLILREIVEKCSKLNIDEKRRISEDYVELVFLNKDIAEWNKTLSAILGNAVKPPGVKFTRENAALTKDYGGIRNEQTLFRKDYDDVTALAMFWPWQDGIHTTLKMALRSRK